MDASHALSIEEQRALLDFVRRCVQAHVCQQPLPDEQELSARFAEHGAVFVTIHYEGRLRGCIGRFSWSEPLWHVAREMAVLAASRDPRFKPVREEELEALTFEISVLSKPQPLADADQIEIGRDGLIVSQGFRRGVLLPQVAPEHGWDVPTFLAHTCRKAGLPEDAWTQEDCNIEAFQAFVFSDEALVE